MRIRTYQLDHLKKEEPRALGEALAPKLTSLTSREEPLRFWTLHKTQAMLVDLSPFRDGDFETRVTGRWAGPFTGRPKLIEQLFPALHTMMAEASYSTVDKYLHSLRSWWRLFDEVEKKAAYEQIHIPRVTTVSDLHETHRQLAHDKKMQRSEFSNFVRVVNFIRNAQNIPKLFWQAPEPPAPLRDLSPEWQIKLIRIELKHMWLDVLLRWQLAEKLMAGKIPENEEQERLRKNYHRLKKAVKRTKNPAPPAPVLWRAHTHDQFSLMGFKKSDMLAGFFPDAIDIRVAFFLCLANTGWNPAVLLSLDATQPIVVPHPKDPQRYLLYGHKLRGDSQQVSEGLFKTQGSAGVILGTLLKRTEPLRNELRKQLIQAQSELATAEQAHVARTQQDKLRAKVISLERGVRSPWIYCTANQGISWLDRQKYMIAPSMGDGPNKRPPFLDVIVDRINTRQPTEKKISYIKSSDFRDAFAAYSYRISGGLVLFVMKALNHKTPKTTQDYLNNTVVNSESQWKFMTFINGLWEEVKSNGRIDPSILAKRSRDGQVTASERARLEEYRTLSRSRLNVGCKKPTNPPKSIAPRFEANGTAMCPIHRCTLCPQNAVIFRDSLSGLAMRTAELRSLKTTMSFQAFLESSFEEELSNTQLALRHFNQDEVSKYIAEWEKKILSGEHRVVQFEFN